MKTKIKKNNKKPEDGNVNLFLLTIKKYWYLFLIGVLGLVVVATSFSGNAKIANLLSTIMDMRNSFQQQVNVIDKLSDDKTKANNTAVKQHNDDVVKIETKKQQALANVQSEKDKEIEASLKKNSKELAQEMKDVFKL